MSAQASFFVINKHGNQVPVDFNKVLERLSVLKNKEPVLRIDIVPVALHTIKMMVNGISTRELDNISVQYCANSISNDYEYDKLAVRIEIDNLHRETESDYLKAIKDIQDYSHEILHPDLISFVEEHHTALNNAMNYSNDYKYSYFGLKTLMKSYLIKHGEVIKERPQQMLMRVAIGINLAEYIDGKCVLKDVLETYADMSSKLYTHATPTLFNAGTHRQSLSSCFLLSIDDDLSEIYRTLTQTAMISKWSGGVGIHVTDVRAQGSIIKSTNGKSEGLAPMLKIFNDSAVYVSQGGGKRKGSTAVYLETWHADIEEFLDLKKPIGDESKRARDLFLALWICDLFMERLMKHIETGKPVMWSLFCPSKAPGLSSSYGDEYKELYLKYESQGLWNKQVPIGDIWTHILEIQMEAGVPYIVYKDHVNKKSNQNNLGTIKSSNLCVLGNTKILTTKGYIPIKDLAGEQVRIWNGTAFSDVVPSKTGSNQKVVRVKFDDGAFVDCTEYHKFYLKSLEKNPMDMCFSSNFGSTQELFARTCDLKKRDQIISCKWPVLVCDKSTKVDYYTLGYLKAQPWDLDNRIVAYHFKKVLNKLLNYTHSETDRHGNKWYYIDESTIQGDVPLTNVYNQRIDYLRGCIDACGYVRGNKTSFTYNIHHRSFEFLHDLKMLCNTMGMNPRISNSGTLLFSEHETVHMLRTLGLRPAIIKHNPKYNRWLSSFAVKLRPQGPRVVSVEPLDGLHDTYCFTEKMRGKGIFNGVITGNCAEINIYTDKDNVGVCNLASICLNKFVTGDSYDYNKLHAVTQKVVKNLNKVIDNNVYPVPEGKASDRANRPIGLGVQALAKAFFKLGIPFVSPKSREVNKLIFETIHHAALTASCELAERDGPYSNYEGSPISKGVLQFDMWGVEPSDLWDWNSLRARIAKHGIRNSLLIALMPTASTAQIMNNTESFEPITSNIFVRNTLSGTFQVVNKHLVKDLITLNLWTKEIKDRIISDDGSVQKISEIPYALREKYKTVWEIPQRHLIEMEADRNAYVCQSTSSNRYLRNPSNSKLTSMHIFSWRKGLKTGMYYLRSQAAASAIKYNVPQEECTVCMA